MRILKKKHWEGDETSTKEKNNELTGQKNYSPIS